MSGVRSNFLGILLIACSPLVLSAQDNSTPQRQQFDHKLKITSRYNQPSDTTVVQFFLKQPNSLDRLAGGTQLARTAFGEDVGISFSFSHSGKQPAQPVEAADLWIAYTGGARTAITSEMKAMADGQEIVLGRQVQSQEKPSREGIKVSSFSLSVTRSQLLQLANAAKVVLVLPSGERVTLTRQQRNALADFVSRMSPVH
ncbi:MAG TPA: hypothetical protein VFR80_02640 [Pyrinomonadaceae bacterium]|nr:hypothetical protein [Pyrinomonadaceae bacterium]